MAEVLSTMYKVMLAVGLVVPTLSIVLGGLGGAFGVDLDMDGDAGFDPPVPLSLTALFCGLAITGLIGNSIEKWFHPLVTFVTSAGCGSSVYLCMFKWVVLPLRKNNSEATKHSDMRGKLGTVTVAIPYGGIGEAEFRDKQGSLISYTVRNNDLDFQTYDKIGVGEKVLVVGIEGNHLIVCVMPSENNKAERKGVESTC